MARVIVGALSGMAATAGATASAQQAAPPADAVPAPADGAPPAPGAAPAPALPPPPAVAAPVVASVAPQQPETARAPYDFDVNERRWAIGYMGISQVPIGLGAAGATITVPALGVRYWATESVGIDVGLGIGWAGGSTSVTGTSMDKDSVFGFVLQAGLPLALATHRHVSFQVIPYFAIAHGETATGTGVAKTDLSGQRIDVGARAGFEIFFGFIGIPELALSATVGLQFESLKFSSDSNGVSSSDTTLGFSTTVQNNPWDIFAGNVAARYYF
jgi:hypothetical protein